MQDFNDFVSKDNSSKKENNSQGIMDMVSKMASQFEGKSQSELIKAIFDEAKKRKANGTLSNGEIDGFYNMLYPMLDGQKQRILSKIIADLKKI
ncbi:MAG: hypothetical protein IJW43_02850 [Clostridia bacterium]|nr:hypothetical protein [Clostridia bacterium]